MRAIKTISLATASAMLLLPTVASAAATNADDKGGNYNMVLISLVGLMIILLLIIGVLTMTLSQLGVVVREKMRKERKAASNITKSLLLLILSGFSAVSTFAADAAKAAAPVSHSISGIAENDFYVLIGILLLELVVIFALVINIRLLLRSLSTKAEQIPGAIKEQEHSWFWDKFNAAKPLEQEKDVLLDHNYDGIQELDNSLPPWWKYGFYLTIIVGFIYMYRYYVSHDGPSQQEEYAIEMEKGEADKAAYLAMAGNNVDENTVVQLKETADIEAGKEIFVKTCAPCHLADGGGAVGPNLTDDYWLHGCGIKDIFKTIKYGWQDKGMKSWKDDFSAKQIQQLASFVKSLRGTKPAVPKLEQGELCIDAAPVVDSIGKNSDSTNAVKK